MEQKEQLSQALRKVFWAYIFLYFDINLGSIDILPAWIGYIFSIRQYVMVLKLKKSLLNY